jgi:hypothetical protein
MVFVPSLLAIWIRVYNFMATLAAVDANMFRHLNR